LICHVLISHIQDVSALSRFARTREYMSDGYTKLFGWELLHSTVWRTPNPVRLTWIAMLAMVNRDGVVEASLPGLADAARVTLDECIEAIQVLSSPDPYSRTKAHEGRRIAECDGGWLLLNHRKYRDKLDAEDRRERDAARKRRSRATRPCVSADSPQCHEPSAGVRVSRDPDPDPDPTPDPTPGGTIYARTWAVPSNWAPNQAHCARALEMGLVLEDQAERFRLYEFERPVSDWDKRFTRWLVDARNYRGKGATARPGGKNEGTNLERQAARVAALRAEEGQP
jgi:hypothetical protein